MAILYAFVILWITYILFIIMVIYTWRNRRTPWSVTSYDDQGIFSVIIPVRDEQDTILDLLRDLEKQELKSDKFEIILVDDHSEDDTKRICTEFMKNTSMNCKLLELTDGEGKKEAIVRGIKESEGDIIITTDGDCRVSPKWLSSLAVPFQESSTKMVVGSIGFIPSKNWLAQFQNIENLIMQVISVVSLTWKRPTMCNGANFAYRKSAFLEINGFEGNENRATGDDVFLLHKMFDKKKEVVRSLSGRSGIVLTYPEVNIRKFFSQRKRWASKWSGYRTIFVRLLALCVFLINFSIVVALILSVAGHFAIDFLITFFILKIVVDSVLVRLAQSHFGTNVHFFSFLITEIIYPFYVIMFAVASRFEGYQWKGRFHPK